MNKLASEDFKHIVKLTPLVSIDLIIENKEGKILLGRRTNAPAKDFWFVPGGRIVKDEGFAEAFSRIAEGELNKKMELDEANFLGVFEHIYPGENFAEEKGFGTHYIVMGYRIRLKDDLIELPIEQHEDYWWADIDELMEHPNVHQNTKNYFNGTESFSER